MNGGKGGFHKPAESIPSPVADIRKALQQYESTGLKNLPATDLVDFANRMGKHLTDVGLKTTQVRRFLDAIRRIDTQSNKGKSFNPEWIVLLRPKLAYAVGRDTSNKIKPFMDVLEPAIMAATHGYEDFKKLLALVEGIIAYHRYHGGKDQ